MQNYEQTLTLAALSLCLLTFIYSIIVRRRSKTHSTLLAQQELDLQNLKEELSAKNDSQNQNINFQNSLQQAEVTTGLQQTRISFHNEQNKSKAPERYAYVLSMFRSGIPTEEISAALGMSTQEITQLIKLSALSQKTEPTALQTCH